MDQFLVSIVMPTYNGASYLQIMIESLLRQTYGNIEIIIVDDGSTDDTLEIVKAYAARYNQVRYFENDINLGINKNFEKAITLSNGDYIFLCDQDDVWYEQKVELMMLEFEKGYDCVYCDLCVVDDQMRLISDSFHRLIGKDNWYSRNTQTIYKCLLFGNITPGCSMAFRRQLVEQIIPFPNYIIYDWWIMLISAQKGRISRIAKPLMSYRIHGNNQVGLSVDMKSLAERQIQTQEAVDRLINMQNDKGILGKNQIKLWIKYQTERLYYLKNKSSGLWYCLVSLQLLCFCPKLFKNLARNLIEDMFPSIYKIAIRYWRKVRMQSWDIKQA